MSGALSYLDKEGEEELVRWITGFAEVGCAKSVREVKAVVSAIVLKKQGVPGICVTYGWWEKFRRKQTKQNFYSSVLFVVWRLQISLVVRRPSLENPCFSNIPLQLSTRKNLRFNKLDQDVTTVAALLNLSKSV